MTQKITSTEKAMAQDYWHMVMTVSDRIEVQSAVVCTNGETIGVRYTNLLAHVFANMREQVIEHARELLAELDAI